MKAPPAFQFYPADFLSGAGDMTCEETGAYIRLLCQQWNKGGLPDDDARLAIMAGQCQASALAKAKSKFGMSEDGLLRNARLEQEREKQNAYRAKQAENGAKRWVGYAKPDAKPDASAIPTHVPNGCSSSSSSSSSSIKTLREVVPTLVKSNCAEAPTSRKVIEELSLEVATAPKPDDTASWIAELQADPTYAGIDVAREFGKMTNWCRVNGKVPTKRRFANWLNRVDKPICGSPTATDYEGGF